MHPRLAFFRVALASAVVAVGGASCRQASLPPDEAAVDLAPRRVRALGRIEPASGVISISAVPGDQLLSYAEGVEEGAVVAAGADLGRLASVELRQRQLDAVATRLELTSAQQRHQQAVAKAQLEQAVATLAQAEAKLQEVRSQRLRLNYLAEAAAIGAANVQQLEQLQKGDPQLLTEQQLRRRRNQSDRAIKEYEAAEASYGPTVAAAEKAVDAARANVALAQQNVNYAQQVDQSAAVEMERKVAEQMRDQSVLRAPALGNGHREYVVLKTFLRPGEFVAQIPVLQLGDLSRMACLAEVYEADAKELAIDQPVLLQSAAFSGKYAESAGPEAGLRGRVTRIGRVISSPGLINRNPLAPSDRSVVEVRIAIDDADPEAVAQARQRVGLQVTVEFLPAPANAPADDIAKPAADARAAPALIDPGKAP